MSSIISEPTTCPPWCVHPHQAGATVHESEPVKWTPDEVSNTDLPFEVCLVVDPDWGNTELLYLSAPGDGLTSIADARKLAETILEHCDRAEGKR